MSVWHSAFSLLKFCGLPNVCCHNPAGCPVLCCEASRRGRAACNAKAVGKQRGGLGEAEQKAQAGFGSVKWSVEPRTEPAELQAAIGEGGSRGC